MIYASAAELPQEVLNAWDTRWPNFLVDEPNLACPCCGEMYYGDEFILGLDRIQASRVALGKPIRLNSVHRCWHRNALVGGAPLSMHKKAAFDVSTRGHDRKKVLEALKKAGFSTFGLYKTFIHTDVRVGRFWYGHGGKEIWNG